MALVVPSGRGEGTGFLPVLPGEFNPTGDPIGSGLDTSSRVHVEAPDGYPAATTDSNYVPERDQRKLLLEHPLLSITREGERLELSLRDPELRGPFADLVAKSIKAICDAHQCSALHAEKVAEEFPKGTSIDARSPIGLALQMSRGGNVIVLRPAGNGELGDFASVERLHESIAELLEAGLATIEKPQPRTHWLIRRHVPYQP